MGSPGLSFGGRRLVSIAGAVLLTSVIATPAFAGASVLGHSADHLRQDRLDQPAIQFVQNRNNERAREQALIGRLEEEIRRLNGRIEELEFQQRQTNSRLDQLIGDLDQRFGSLEGNSPAASGAEVDDQISRSSDQPRTGDDDLLSAEQALRDLTSPGDGSLGSVPESAVSSLPRPNPDDIAEPAKGSFTPEQQYENAVKLLQAGNFQGAQSGLELFLDVHEGHQLASNAAYWLAETHYVRQNYSAAAAAFARNYRNYGKDAPKAIDNLLKLGMSLSNLGEGDKACLTYEELTKTFPNTPAHIQQALNRERARAQCG